MKRGLEWAANLVLRTPQRLTNGESSTPTGSPTTEPRDLSFSPSPNYVPPATPENLRQMLDKNFKHFMSKANPEARNEGEEKSNEGLKAVVRVNRTIATGASRLISQQSLESHGGLTPAVTQQIEDQTPVPSHHQDSASTPKVRPFKGGWPVKANPQTRSRTLANVDRPGLRFAPAPIPAPDRKTGKAQSSRFFRTNSFDAIPEQPRNVFARPQSASVIPSMQKSDQPASRPQRQTLAEVSVAIHQAREEQSDFERQAKRPKLGDTLQKATDVEPNETRPNVRVRRFIKKREFVQPRSSRHTHNLHTGQAEPKKDPAPGDPDFIPRLHLKPMSETAKKILAAFDNGEWDKEQQQKKALALENAPSEDLGPPSISLQEKLPKTIQGIRVGTPTIGPYFTKRHHEESQENIEETIKPTVKKARKTGKYGLPSDSEDEELAEPSTPDALEKDSPFKALPPRPKEQGSELKSFLKNVKASGPHEDFHFGKTWPLEQLAVTSPKRPPEDNSEETTLKKFKGEPVKKSNGSKKIVEEPAPVVSSWGADFLAKNKRQQESATKAAEAFIKNTDGKEEDPANKPKPAFKFGIPPKTAQETNGPLVGGDQTDIAEPEKTEFKFGAPPTKSDKPAFTFGIPSTSSDQPNFKFGVPAAKEPEKPGVKFGVPSTKSIEPLKADFRFGVPASIQSQEPAKPAFSFGLSTQIVAEADKEPRASSPSFVFNQGSTDTQQPLSSGNKTKESTPNLGTSNFQPTAGAGGLGGPSIVEPFAFGKPNLTESSTPAPILTNATTATREGQDADSVASPMSISPPPAGPEGQSPGGLLNFGAASTIKFGQPAQQAPGSLFGSSFQPPAFGQVSSQPASGVFGTSQSFSFGTQPTPAFGSGSQPAPAQPSQFGNGAFGASAPSFSMPGQFQPAAPTMAQPSPTFAPQGTGPVMSMGAGMSKDDGRRKVKRKVKK